MGAETRKNDYRRETDKEYAALFEGVGLDIGYGGHLVTTNAIGFDKEHGDATTLESIENCSFDFVHSSHCLEHIPNPFLAIQNWWRVLKYGGHLILTVPDFYLYEHGQWPSQFNKDHRVKFTILERDNTIKILDLFSMLNNCQIRWVRTNDKNFIYHDNNVNYDYADKDQTRGPAQAEIEVVAKKMLTNMWTG